MFYALHEACRLYNDHSQINCLISRCASCPSKVTESVVIISADLDHDATAVHKYNSLVLQHLEKNRDINIQKQVLDALVFCASPSFFSCSCKLALAAVLKRLFWVHFTLHTSVLLLILFILFVSSSSLLMALQASSRAENPSWILHCPPRTTVFLLRGLFLDLHMERDPVMELEAW